MGSAFWELTKLISVHQAGSLVTALKNAAHLGKALVVISFEDGKIHSIGAVRKPSPKDYQAKLLRLLDEIPPIEGE